MKTNDRIRAAMTLAAMALVAITPATAAPIAPIVSLTGSHGGDQYANGLISLTNGSGITKTNATDPATWSFNGTAYGDEWMATYLAVASNPKVAWGAFDLGASKRIVKLWLFNTNYSGGTSGVAQYNLYYTDSPAVALPAQPAKATYATTGLTPQGDYNFTSGGWTKFNTSGALNATKAGINSLDLTGISARYLAVEILSNHGDTYQGGRVGFDEVAVTVFPAYPSLGVGVPAGNVNLTWTNLPPNTGSNVYVDVWFGANPAALTQVVTAGLNTTNTTVSAPSAGTYYWRVDSYLDGTPTGTPVQSELYSFVVNDSDGDGLPDSYELAYTSPASATSMNPGDDSDSDGLTNLQEYQRGTLPNNPDSDGDTLNDGPEVTGAGARPATDPLKADTDGDGLSDGVESNTGTWAGVSNTGTNPTAIDTDADGLTDNVENNTGTYVSATNTGTSPLASDSDNDNAGDWYEVAASFTSPTNATSKPNIPYPLPAPGSSTGVTNKPVKVYIMSGQSNMVGFGRTSGTGVGTLNTMVNSEKKFPNLVTGTGAWAARQDVRYRGVISAIGNDVLKPGFGANTDSFGPELGFGHVMGWYHDEPVLLLKTSIGNRSLLWDCLPPGGARFNYNGQTYAGYGESPNSWTIGGGPTPYTWYAGREYDTFFLDEEDMRPAMTWVDGRTYPVGCQLRHNGVQYVCKLAHAAAATSQPGIGATWTASWDYYNVTNAVDVLDNFATDYAGSGKPFQGQDFEIAGYVWFQGNKDLGEPGASRYEANLVALITQLRAYYANRYPGKCSPTAPFVIATGCGDPGTTGGGLVVANGQLAMNDAVKYPHFAGNVKTMDTRGYWRNNGPNTAQGFHYNHNAETYLLTGDALGRGMIDLLGTATPNGFTSWQTANGAASQTFAADHDGDGVSNGIEFFIGGPSGNTTGFTALPGIATAPVTGALSITWTKAAGYAGTYGTDFRVETSDTLTGAWIAETLGGTVTITGNNITYTFPSLPGDKKFARLRVTGP